MMAFLLLALAASCTICHGFAIDAGLSSCVAHSSDDDGRQCATALSMAASTDEAGVEPRQTVKKGSIVTVECRLKPEGDFVPEPLFDGIVLNNEHGPETLSFVLGEGNYLPGLHDLISTMTPGGEMVEDVSLDAGWGSWNPKLEATMALDSLGEGLDASQIKVGVELMLASGISAVVTKVTDTEFTIDANPPLAGASYLATVKLVSVADGPAELLYSPAANEGSKYQVATFALGCFWGGELEFMREPGVVGSKVGYTQGHAVNPTYQEVCSGTTGHTEGMMITYDPSIVTYERLVRLTMDRLEENKYLLNQVGNDKGTQYRHGIYYHNDEQKKVAESIVASFGEKCVTEVLPANVFYDAEEYHQQYLLKGGQTARKGDDTTIRCYG